MKVRTRTKNDIVMSDHDDRVTIEVTGKAFANLKEITQVYNQWCAGDCLPSDMIELVFLIDPWFNLQKKKVSEYEESFFGFLCAMYSDEPDIEQLESALSKAGFDTIRKQRQITTRILHENRPPDDA